MTQQIVRFFYPYGSPRLVIRGPARGMRFVVAPGIGFSYAVATDSAVPRQLANRIKPGMTVYDVGANKGQMALLFAACVGPAGRVVSLEPAPSEFASLRQNLELNRLTRVRPMQAAAGEAEGEIMFAYHPESPTQGKFLEIAQVYGDTGQGAFPVRSLPLDALLGDERPPDVMKIDVEGAAASVLRGAARILSEFGPSIYLELHSPGEQAAVKDELLSRGYVARTMDGRVIADPTGGWHSPLWCDKPPGG